MQFIIHVGKNEYLALAELQSVLGLSAIVSYYGGYFLVESEVELGQKFLDATGSVISIFKVWKSWQGGIDRSVEQDLDAFESEVGDYIMTHNEKGKVCYAASSNYLPFKDIELRLRNCKKNLKKSSIQSRFILNYSASAFKSASGSNVQMFGFGMFKFKELQVMGVMVGIQNIDSYSYRDYSKPFRSAKLGMLPPKLAQIMLNVGRGAVGSNDADKQVYDPFCGTGTVLMESLLMGGSAKGSDIVKENIIGSQKNLEWLREKFEIDKHVNFEVFVRDARKLEKFDLAGVDCIVTEGFLGVPKQGKEKYADLEKEILELRQLYLDFLTVVAQLFAKLKATGEVDGLNLVLCLPVYLVPENEIHKADGKKNLYIENLVEKLELLGYSVCDLVPENSLGFKPKSTVLYKRNTQKVYRQLMKLTIN